MSRTELAQVMPWRERVPCNGTASPGHRLFKARADQGLLHGNNYEQRFAWTNSAGNVQGEALFFCCLACSRISHAKRVWVHFMAPFLAMAKLERARFCSWLIERVVTSCKSCIGCFPSSAGNITYNFSYSLPFAALSSTLLMKAGVKPFLLLATASGVPVESTCPPRLPPSGPMSMM